jgi:hypothetical protein
MSLGRIIIKMIVGRVGGRGEKMLMRCLFLCNTKSGITSCKTAANKSTFDDL